MNTLSVPSIAMAAVTFYVALNHTLIYFRGARQREHVTFALTCLAWTLFDVCCAGLYNVNSVQAGIPWQRGQGIALNLAATGLLWFISDYTLLIPRRIPQIYLAYALLDTIVALVERSGLKWLLDQPAIKNVQLFGSQITYYEVAPGPLFIFQHLMGGLLIIYLFWVSARFCKSGQQKKATPMLLALGLTLAAILSDTAVSFGAFDFIYIMEYAYLGVVLVMTYSLSTAVVESVQVKESLRESEGRYRALVETVHGWMWEANAKGVYTYVSPGVRDVLGYEPEELLGRKPFDLMPSQKAGGVINIFKTLAAAQAPIKALETVNMHKNGRLITLETNGAPFFDAQGAFMGYRGIARDVTRQRLAEAEREQLQREVIEAQRQTLRDLSTPIIPVMDTPQGNVIVMPLIGNIDSTRAKDITRSLLAGIREHQAAVVIMDITGVSIVDSEVANHLNKTIQTARLKGTHAIVTGVSEAVAETIVDLGIDWGKIDTLSDLQSGLIVALNSLGFKLTQ